jgi:hypothetical protein
VADLVPKEPHEYPVTHYRVYGRWPSDEEEIAEPFDDEADAISAARRFESAGALDVQVERVTTMLVEERAVIYGENLS